MNGKMLGQPDLEGVFICILAARIPGVDINICQECAIHALSGTHGFERNGNVVTLANKPLKPTG